MNTVYSLINLRMKLIHQKTSSAFKRDVLFTGRKVLNTHLSQLWILNRIWNGLCRRSNGRLLWTR